MIPYSKLEKIKIFVNKYNTQWARKLKKSRAKKLVKSNKSISLIFFLPYSTFCYFKNGQKSIFELGKSLKLPKLQFHEKNFFDLFHLTKVIKRFDEFFCLDCFKFSGPLWPVRVLGLVTPPPICSP